MGTDMLSLLWYSGADEELSATKERGSVKLCTMVAIYTSLKSG